MHRSGAVCRSYARSFDVESDFIIHSAARLNGSNEMPIKSLQIGFLEGDQHDFPLVYIQAVISRVSSVFYEKVTLSDIFSESLHGLTASF